ncbi:hypothetical protein ACF064_32735 [Streptomyces sp. NPDC015492]|uniref:hypothetical protein n=1 Tax=Streptomyces sp. NPDC015492 TaxID=3364958 RepID=UPI0036FDC422
MTTEHTVDIKSVVRLAEVHQAQLRSMAQPWFNRDVKTAEEFFVLLGELYGELAEDMKVYLSHIAAEGDPELVLYDYWSDPGTGTGNYFYADTVEETGGYEVQHHHEGTPLEETREEARTRALKKRYAL